MKHTFKSLAIALAIINSPFSSLNSSAAVPVEWSCDIDSGSPRAVAAYRGETLLLKCTFTRRGAPISAPAAAATLYWQTNGMAAAWWSTNAAVSGASVSAPFTPAMDPGAEQCTFFFSVADADGTNYRANGRIRFAPSPGVSPNTLMPEPGATINFTGTTVVGAPWATLEQIDATLGAYATTQALDEVRARVPDVSPFATTSQVADVAASIPSLSGYATEAYVQSAVSNIPAPDLSVYASRAYADAAASNAQANAISRIPSLSGYATQSYVQNAITNISAPSLDGYASKAYADAAASNAQANAVSRIPSLSGYATETYVQNAITNISAPSLDGYATRAYADAAASNAQANAIARIPSLSGYATETYVQNAITNISIPSLDGYASKVYADAAASNAQANAVSRIPSLSGYATETYVQNALTNIPIPSLDGYATRAYADAAASNVAATAAATYLTGVPDYYATKSYVMDQVQTGGGHYSAGVWSEGYVLDATGVVYTATIITNSIPTPPYATNTTTYIEGGVTTTVETVTTNYTYEVVTNLAPAFKAFLYDASTSPESAIADAALTGPVFYSDSSRIFFRVSDVLYECDDGTWLEYSNGRWRYSDGGSTYDCINGDGLPANDISPPAILQWYQGGIWEMVTRGSVLETFPLLYNRASLGGADYETVSNRAMSAVQPGEMTAATNSLSERFIPIEGSEPIITSVSLYLNLEWYEQGMLMFMLPNGEQSNAVSFVQSSMLTNEGAVVAARAYTDAAVASAVPAGVVVTNESGQIESDLSIMGGISAGGSLQALNGTFYGLLTVNGTDITDAIAANAAGISAARADLAAATNAVYKVFDGLPDTGSVLATNTSGYVDKSVRGLFFASELNASPQNVKLWQPQMDWLEIDFVGEGGYKFTIPVMGELAPYQPWQVQEAPDLVMRWVDTTNEIARIDYGARVGDVLTNRLGAVEIGYHAKASAGGFGAVAIGSNTTATANCAVSIGANSDATATAGIAIGCDAGASGANGIALGLGAAATAQKGIAIGQGAKAYASSAVQIGTGSNSAEETVNFYGVCVFSNGTLVVEGGGGETPAEVTVTDTVPYSKGLVNLTVTSGGTLACNTNGWANGAQVLVNASLPAAYTAASGVEPVGYSSMPTDGQYLLVFTRIWGKVYVSVITSEE